MKPFLSLLLFIALCGTSPLPPVPAPNPDLDIRHYLFRLTLSDDTDAVAGETDVTVRFRADGVGHLDLDLVGPADDDADTGMRVLAVTESDHDVAFEHVAHRLRIDIVPAGRAGEERTFTVAYAGIPADGLLIDRNKFGDRTFFGDNWPNRARHWLPVVDHPSDKATTEFIVTAPDHYQVVGSGTLVEEVDLDEGQRRTHWRTDAPLPTKVIVIGAARFAVLHQGLHEGIPIQSWVYPQDREAGYHDFAVTAPMLAYFEDFIGPYPYEKLANVQSKTRYGGMENASNIFYGENEITGRRRNELTVAHEIAHQWFGNSVTEVDWSHIWLSEGFATYFSYLYLEHAYGREPFLENLALSRDYILEYYEAAPTPLVYQAEDVNDYLNANSYEKGAWVLHMLRGLVGDDAFRAGIARFYAAYSNSNASSDDFRTSMEAAAGLDLGWFFDEWLYQPGQPAYEGQWRYDADSTRLTVTLRQTQTDSTFFRMPLELGIYTGEEAGGDATPRIERLAIDAPEETFTFPLDTAPRKVVLDPNGWVLMKADFERAPEK